ncbi:diacylglycerol/lipid kinase family protein [Brevibacterium renqingii]|uniref:diacylglycerol/lipid kinase family protein n=1 Tax=Brevibacterium renqingii TaxID=2776916 RepID=UPI001AE06F8B
MEDRAERLRATTNVGIIINPKHAATNRAYSTLTEALRDRRVAYRTMTTTAARGGRWQAEQLVDWGAKVVIILGGDGTIRAAAPPLAGAGILVLLVPTGTANVLSRHVGISSTRQAVEHCLHTLRNAADGVRMHSRGIPLNTAEARLADGRWQQTVFLCLAGIGGDARAVARHHLAPGLLGYAWGAARALFAQGFNLDDTDRTASEPVWSVMASKVPRPAGPVSVFPAARIDGAEFSELIVGPLPHGRAQLIRAWAGIAAACLQSRPEAHPLMHYRSTTAVTARLKTPAPAQLDGDVLGDCLELRLSVGEQQLLVSSPSP